MNRSFEEEIKINKWKLDDECESHSSLYLYWSEELATAKAEKDDAEDQLTLSLSVVESDLHLSGQFSTLFWGKKKITTSSPSFMEHEHRQISFLKKNSKNFENRSMSSFLSTSRSQTGENLSGLFPSMC